MRKIFSLSLIAVALLISGQVKAAEDECTLKIGNDDPVSYATFESALKEACKADHADKSITITMLTDGNVETSTLPSPSFDVSIANNQKITIDMGEDPDRKISGSFYKIRVKHGSLDIKGKGTLQTTYSVSNENCMFYVLGSQNDVEGEYSVLTVGKDITISSPTGYAICVFGYTLTSSQAFGARLNVYGHVEGEQALAVSGNVKETKGNVPVITLDGATLISPENKAGVYAGGYAIWNINNSTILGGVGFYAKAGDININSSSITSNATVLEGQYQTPVPDGNGYTGGVGSAIVLDSKNGYADKMSLSISGSSTITGAENAYALDELKTDATASKTDAVVISGGTISGDINTTAEVKDNIVLNGSITGGTFSDQTIKEYISNVNGVIEVTTGAGGETVYVVNGMPSGKVWKDSLSKAGEDDYVKIESATGSKQYIKADKKVAYLNVPKNDTIVVTDGAIFSVGEAVLGSDAVLEVEPGSKVIIEETNGVIAFEPENLIIKANAEDGMATFLINPDVKANKSPKATIEFMTNAACGKIDNSKVGAPNDYRWEMIASPFVKIDTIISEVPTYYERIEENGFVQRSKKVIIDETVPFEMLAICPDNAPKEGGYKYTFVGTLQGANDLSNFPVEKKFNYLGNAYTAKMDAEKMISELKEDESAVRSVVYLWLTSGMKWQVYNSKELPKDNKIKPMEAFVLYSDADGKVSLDYEELIWKANK